MLNPLSVPASWAILGHLQHHWAVDWSVEQVLASALILTFKLYIKTHSNVLNADVTGHDFRFMSDRSGLPRYTIFNYQYNKITRNFSWVEVGNYSRRTSESWFIIIHGLIIYDKHNTNETHLLN